MNLPVFIRMLAFWPEQPLLMLNSPVQRRSVSLALKHKIAGAASYTLKTKMPSHVEKLPLEVVLSLSPTH